MSYKDVVIIYKCDECKKTFIGKNVKLKLAKSNVQLIEQHVYIVDENDMIKTTPTENIKKGDRTLYCPHCEASHLFGFVIAT